MSALLDLLLSLALVIGSIFTLVGSYGLVKLDQPMSRLHAPTKASTLGVGAILVAAVVAGIRNGTVSVHELLITAFLFLTAPVVALFLAKVVIHRRRYGQPLPPPGEDPVWATEDVPGEDARG